MAILHTSRNEQQSSIRGFTLIELLVVIAIIGVLGAIVLASLNGARSKGDAAAVKSNLHTVQVQADIMYEQLGGSYSTVGDVPSGWGDCEGMTDAGTILQSPTISDAISAAKKASGDAPIDCRIRSDSYTIAVSIGSGKAWCIDSTGVARDRNVSGVPYDSVTGGANAAHFGAPVRCR